MGINLNEIIKQQQEQGSLVAIENMTVIYAGAETSEYKPWIDKPNKVKAEKPTGYTLYFTELGTSRRVWYRHNSLTDVPKPDTFGIYQLSGLGHNKQYASDVHIQEQCTIKKIGQLDVVKTTR